MSWRAALLASLGAVVDRPRWWLLALAGFLLRGGALVFLLPIVILPTPAGLANAVAPTLVGFVFGSPSEAFVGLVVAATVALVLWLLLGGYVGGWLEVALVREVAGIHDERSLALRALGIRLASHLPFAVALSWGVVRVVDAVYTELVAPGDVATPIALRVVLRVPEVVVLLVATWLAGEAAGGLGVRIAVLGEAAGARTSGWLALLRGWRVLLRPASLATLLLTTALVAGVAAAAATSSGFAWTRVREALTEHAALPLLAYTLGSFIAIWLAGMGLVAAAAAARSAVWTAEATRREARSLPEDQERPATAPPGTGPDERHAVAGRAV